MRYKSVLNITLPTYEQREKDSAMRKIFQPVLVEKD